MDNGGYSRRDFLATFAALSATPFLAGMLTGCGPDGLDAKSSYGPPPVIPANSALITGIYYLDAQSSRTALDTGAIVPLQPTIIIDFNAQMDVASVIAALSLSDLNGNNVACTVSANLNAQYSNEVTVVPSTALAPSTYYALRVTNAAVDIDGNHLYTPGGSTAGTAFKTTA